MKKVITVITVGIVLLTGGISFGSDTRPISTFSNVGATHFCLAGHLFAGIIGFGRQGQINTSLTQVYQEKNGKTVPMKCEDAKPTGKK